MSEPAQSNGSRRPSFYKKRYLDKIDSFLDDLLNDLKKNDRAGLKRLLDFYSTKFQRWSPRNIVGIFIQKPRCERPVTVSEAKALGHTIKPGVPRAAILVPVFKPEDVEQKPQEQVATQGIVDNRVDGQVANDPQSTSQTNNKPEIKLKLIGFKVVPCVIDLGKETEGPPILVPNKPEEQNSAEALLEALGKFASEKNIVVDDHLDRAAVLAGATGISGKRRDGVVHISTMSALPPAKRFQTLVHELTHGMLHSTKENEERERKAEELQAAGVSYFVGKHFGLEDDFSPLYLQNWGVTGNDVLKNLAIIVKAAREITEGVARHLGPKEAVIEALPRKATPVAELDQIDEYEIEEVLDIIDDTAEHFSRVVYVYHANDMRTADTADFNEDNYTLVARCEHSNLADAFGKTQNIEGSWAAGSDVNITVYGQKRQRSSSVGDVFLVEGEGYYKVNADGWVLIKEAETVPNRQPVPIPVSLSA
jgi:hypothetical protein